MNLGGVLWNPKIEECISRALMSTRTGSILGKLLSYITATCFEATDARTPDHPKAPLGNNYRPTQPLLHRPVRTNIDFKPSKQNGGKVCATMYRDFHYKEKEEDFDLL
uniref:Uncharacterized protein n=1 Tax=Megaselia scalaris TaxID=36166 RepID=T1H586_MEGSC